MVSITFSSLLIIIATVGTTIRAAPAPSPIGPALAVGGLIVGAGAGMGAIIGANDGKAVAETKDGNGEDRSKEEKEKIELAGTLKGAIDGALFLPGVALGQVTNSISNFVASKTLDIKDKDNMLTKASYWAGTPLLNLFPGIKGFSTSLMLINPDPSRSFKYGDLDALVQYKDQEGTVKKNK